jgi:excinuclease ABC subunit B
MYADRITGSMRRAIEETNRRRELQLTYNEEHGIKPESVRKAIRDLLVEAVAEEAPLYGAGDGLPGMSAQEIVAELERDMKLAARELRFEEAAKLRDRIRALQGESLRPAKTYAKPARGGRRRRR